MQSFQRDKVGRQRVVFVRAFRLAVAPAIGALRGGVRVVACDLTIDVTRA